MPFSGPVPSHIQRLRVCVESTFGTDATGSLASFIDVPANQPGATFTIDPERNQNPGYVMQNMLDYQTEVRGKRSWTLSFTLNLAPTGTAAGSATVAVQGALGLLLKNIMGGEFLGTGSTASGAWVSGSTGDVADASGFSEGGCAIWVDSAGVAHMQEIESISTNTLTLKREFPGSPADTDVIYSGATYYWTQNPSSSFQFIVEGQEAHDRWVFAGGQGTFTPAFNLDGTLQTVAFEFAGCKVIPGDEAAGTASIYGTDLGTATYSNYEPITGHTGKFSFTSTGTATATNVDVSAFSVTHNISNQAITSPNGVEGVARYRRIVAAGSSVAEGSFTTYFEDFDAQDMRTDATSKAIMYVNGVEAGKMVGVSLPTVQVTDVQTADANGIQSETVSFKARLDSETSEGTATDMGRSPSRYHLG